MRSQLGASQLLQEPATWSGTAVQLEHTESTQGGDGLGRGTSCRHHLPGLHFLPDSRWPRLFWKWQVLVHRVLGTGTGHSQEVTRRFRPCCFDTCHCAKVYTGDIFALTPVKISKDYVQKTHWIYFHNCSALSPRPWCPRKHYLQLSATENHKQGHSDYCLCNHIIVQTHWQLYWVILLWQRIKPYQGALWAWI